MDEQTVNAANDDIFEASDFEPVANDSNEEQAIESDNGSAVEETNEPASEEIAQESTETETTQESQSGDAIDEFLAKKGINASDPEAIRKIAQMYQNAEKGFYQKAQEKAQLERQIAQARVPQQAPDQEALSQVRAMRTEMNVQNWKNTHQITPETEQKMIDYINQPMTDASGQIVTDVNGNPIKRGVMVLNGALSLDDVFSIVGGNEIKVDTLKEQLRNDIRKEMMARQTAKRPAANATDSTKFGKPSDNDPFLSGLGF